MRTRQSCLTRTITVIMLMFCVAISLLACRSTVASENQLMEFWDLDIGQEGYVLSSASHSLTWNSQGINLVYGVFPTSLQPLPTGSGFKIIKASGQEYYLREDVVAWDAEDSSGTMYSRGLTWQHGQQTYILTAEASEPEVSLSIISPETAAKLQKDSTVALTNFELTLDSWNIGFSKGDANVVISIQPARFGGDTFLQEFVADPDTVELKAGSLTYYQNKIEDRKLDDPHAVSLMWQTSQGLVWLSGGIPYAHRNDVPDDTLDFINIDLIKSLTVQIEN